MPPTASPQAAKGEIPSSSSHPKHRDCEEQKEVYDRCFRNWYRYSYLRKEFDDPCSGHFQEYNSCLKKSLASKGLDALMETDNPIWDYGSR